jgi:hypothetical protein
MYLVALALVPLLVQTTFDVGTLAVLACGEAGGYEGESTRVLRVVKNRADNRNTSLIEEATRPYQFYLKGCRGRSSKWLKKFHITLAIRALAGTIKAREEVLNHKDATHFATTRRLRHMHSRCVGYTIREVWTYSGLKSVVKTEVGHEFFKQVKKYTAGCPPTILE